MNNHSFDAETPVTPTSESTQPKISAAEQASRIIEQTLRSHSQRYGNLRAEENAGILEVSGWVGSYYALQLVIGLQKQIHARLALPLDLTQLKVSQTGPSTRP